MPATPSDSLPARAPIHVRAESDAAASSEAASLGGQPAKTPIIAGSVCGGVLVIAWIVGFAIYFRKRQRRKKQKRAAEEGLCEPPPEKTNPARSDSERIVIPPDPAILLGYAKAGDIAHPAALSTPSLHEKDKKKSGHVHTRSHSHVKSHSKSPSPPGHSRSVSESGLGVGQSKRKKGEGYEEGQRPGHSRSGSAHSSRSAKQLPPVPTSPSNFIPLNTLGSPGHNHLHKKAHSHSHSHSSSSKSRPSPPRKAPDIDDEMTVPLNPHET